MTGTEGEFCGGVQDLGPVIVLRKRGVQLKLIPGST